jgi:hypothetical protein
MTVRIRAYAGLVFLAGCDVAVKVAPVVSDAGAPSDSSTAPDAPHAEADAAAPDANAPDAYVPDGGTVLVPGTYEWGIGLDEGAWGLRAAPDGTIYVTGDTAINNSEIGGRPIECGTPPCLWMARLNPSGEARWVVTAPFTEGQADDSFPVPSADGVLWIGDAADSFSMRDTSGAVSSPFPLVSGQAPFEGRGNFIVRLTPDGVFERGTSIPALVESAAYDALGNVYLAGMAADSLSAGGQVVTGTFVASLDATLTPRWARGLPGTDRVNCAVSGANVWVQSDDTSGASAWRLMRLPTDGTSISELTLPGFGQPGIAAGPDGSVFAAPYITEASTVGALNLTNAASVLMRVSDAGVVWAHKIPGTDNDGALSPAFDAFNLASDGTRATIFGTLFRPLQIGAAAFAPDLSDGCSDCTDVMAIEFSEGGDVTSAFSGGGHQSQESRIGALTSNAAYIFGFSGFAHPGAPPVESWGFLIKVSR